MNWDAHNRQEKLWRWIRDHGNYAWLEQLPRPNETEIDDWAKRQVRISASNVRKVFEEKTRKANCPEGKISINLEIKGIYFSFVNVINARLGNIIIYFYLQKRNLKFYRNLDLLNSIYCTPRI